MARARYFQELATPAALDDLSAVAARMLDRRFGVGAAMYQEQWWHLRRRSRDWGRARDEVRIDVARQLRNGAKVVKSPDQHRANDPRNPLRCQQRCQLRAGVLAEQHKLVGVDSKFGGSASNERERAGMSVSESSNRVRFDSR